MAWYDCFLGDHIDLPGVPGVAHAFGGIAVDVTEDVFCRCKFYAEVTGGRIQIPIHYRSDELPLRCADSFVLPDGATAIRVRSVYCNSGEHTQEEIAFTLD